MAFQPKAGLVVEFPYMWKDEADAGDDNPKRRPCIIIGVEQGKHGMRVSVLPISHTVQFEAHVEVPKSFLKHAGLDGRDNYVITEELNVFDWPPKSADLSVRPVGYVPEGFFNRLKEEITNLREKNYLDEVDRDALAKDIIDRYRGRGG